MIVEAAKKLPLKLTPFVYEGREKRLLAQFEKRLPEKIEPGLEQALLVFIKYDKLSYSLQIGMQVLLFSLVILLTGLDLVRPYFGWPNAVSHQWGTFYRAFSVDKHGAVWFVTKNVNSDAVQVGRLLDGSVDRWDIPSEALADDLEVYGTRAVFGNSTGNPVLLLDKAVLFWTGTEWLRKPIPGDFYWSRGISISEDVLRFIQYEDGIYQLRSCPFEAQGCDTLPVPEVIAAPGANLVFYGGSLIVAGPEEGPITFYRNEDGRWDPVAGPLDLNENSLLAWTFSGDGTLWVLRGFSTGGHIRDYRLGPLAFGHWDAAANEWHWYAVNPFPEGLAQEIDGITVDPRGRIWIYGRYTTPKVSLGYAAAAYVVHDEFADLVVRYTDSNSNLQKGGIVQGPDGRLWSADSALVSLDATTEDLPAPLPAWIADLDNTTVMFVLLGVLFVVEAAYFIVQAVMKREEKKIVKAEGKGG
ncbi:MAG: hypothetical protein JW929_01290 [Anaerolineales bacterium]|nr:hypothetical protein [Anaerolineales bacterium]